MSVPNDQLTARERAVLLVLLAEGREMTNAELFEAAGVKLDGEPRRRLAERKFVASRRVGRGNAFLLTADGVDWCNDELAATWPERAGYLGNALRTLLIGIRLNGHDLVEMVPGRSAAEQQIRGVYRRLAEAPGDWVRLMHLRPHLAHLAQDTVDNELERMASTPGVHVQAEPNQKALSDADREAAVRFGGDERHMLMIEAE